MIPAGTKTASLPARQGGPMGSPRQIDLSPAPTHDRRMLSSSDTDFDVETSLRPLFSLGGAGSLDSADVHLYRTGLVFHAPDGALGAKEAVARRLLANAALEVCLLLLRSFEVLPFAVLPCVDQPLAPVSDPVRHAPELSDQGPSQRLRTDVPAPTTSAPTRPTRPPWRQHDENSSAGYASKPAA